MTSIISTITALFMALTQVFSSVMGTAPAKSHIRNDSKPVNVFVNGMIGYGEKSGINFLVPCYGMTGDLLGLLEDEGYECYLTSQGPFSSIWDAACNIYAELTGTRVDYGAAHAKEHGHARYGREYAKPLVEDWSTDRPVNLWGYSMGGQTVHLLSNLLADGSAEERAATPASELSPLFSGELDGLVHSVTSQNGSLNGTIVEPANLNGKSYKAPAIFPLASLLILWGSVGPLNRLYDLNLDQFGISGKQLLKLPRLRGLDQYFTSNDNAFYDVSPEGAWKVNQKTRTLEDVYYFSYVSDITEPDGKGNWKAPLSQLFNNPADYYFANRVGAGKGYYYGKTFDSHAGKFTIDESWKDNDGQVSVVSARYPFGAPNKAFDAENMERGKWQVMPVMYGYSHLFFCGMDFKFSLEELKAVYLEHLKVLNRTV